MLAPETPLPPASASGSLRRAAGLVAGPLLGGALLLIETPEGLSLAGWRVAALGGWIAVWWMTEALPIAVTSLLPLVAFPLLGIASIGDTAAPYAHPLIFLFLGGFLIARGMERWGLHRRLALGVIRRIGVQPRRIIAGFMVSAAVLSMWISNTATAMMMLPIGLSVIALVPEAERGNFGIALMLGLAYACSLGGVGTLIGTPTNALLAGFVSDTYAGVDLSFVRWMGIGVPLMVVGLLIVFVVLTRWVFPVRLPMLPGGQAFIEAEWQALGPMQQPEIRVAVVFGLTAALWMTRPWLAQAVPGLSDTGIALAGALALFALPSGLRRGERVLDWAFARHLPWGVLLLFGGGLSLAAAIRDTGLAAWIGQGLGMLAAWPVWLLLLLTVALIVWLTELTSNTATAAAFLPVLCALAVGIGQHPLLLVVPATIAASCAFMLPVATPPNAIVYGSGYVTITQMARAGLWLNLAFILLVTLLAFLLVPPLLGVELGVVPAWAE